MVNEHVAITGASSGLGRALALALAHPGVTLHLAGRNAARLAEVAATARALGATVTETLFDVTDEAGAKTWVTSCGKLDLLIANAGISVGPGKANVETAAQIKDVFATNVEGVVNTVLPAIGQKCKTVAVIGSIAGLIALPTSPAYSAAKAAIGFWVTASAPGAAREGTRLVLVRPGFVRTPMTAQNPYPMPGMMDADRAAAIIIKGLAKGGPTITFPWWMGLFTRLGQLVPKRLFPALPNKPG
jgi:NADP-dependent 3-hydroxy acid dehydrogenase YdfG